MREKEGGLAMAVCDAEKVVAASQKAAPLPMGAGRHFHCQSAERKGGKALSTSCKARCNVRPAFASG
jgi:hypothetical protein